MTLGRPKLNFGLCSECDKSNAIRGLCNVHYLRKLKAGEIKAVAPRQEKHGYYGRSEYNAWLSMKGRCSNPNLVGYENYGGRGIKVCTRWQKSFKNFIKDMGDKPYPAATLERKNVNGNYEPSNCEWASWTTQIRNRRVRKDNKIGVTGVSWNKNEKKWASSIKVNYATIRLGMYKNLEDAIKARKAGEVNYFL